MRGEQKRSRQFTPEISPAGRSSAFVTAACLVVTGVVYLIASWDEFTCDPSFFPCARLAGVAGLVSIVALFAVVIGTGIGLAVRRRPLDENGYSGWTWSLGILFALGVMAVVAVLPAWTCPIGTHLDELAGLCINRVRRFDATSWLWLKWLLALAGVTVGVTVIRRPKWIVLTAPIAVLTWLLGFGWLLVETVGRTVAT